MKIPVLQGIIERRMLVNYTADPAAVQQLLPRPFRPKLVEDKAIAGICLIRLKQVRPKGLPFFPGFGSENGAHRIAVEWEEDGQRKEGVYIPRRDTSSWMNTIAGGRIFPGKHYHAKFDVKERDGHYHIAFQSSDATSISVDASITENFDSHSVFGNLETASSFFEKGSVGYSPGNNRHDGLMLKTFGWKMQPLSVSKIHSSFFENERIFPKGTIQFDNALLMTEIRHEWESLNSKPTA